MAIYEPNEEFFLEQLRSIFDQTVRIAEVIISDDGSTADTTEIIEKAQIPDWVILKYKRNQKNLGYTNNFISALTLASGEIIFFSDQDDVWLFDKIENVLGVFEREPGVMVVVHDQIRTDARLNEETFSTIENYERKGWSTGNLVHGCASAFRAEITPLVESCPEEFGYDDWLHTIGEGIDARYVCSERLMKFRRHSHAATIIGARERIANVGIVTRAKSYLSWRKQENRRRLSSLELLANLVEGDIYLFVSEERRLAWLKSVQAKLAEARLEHAVLFGGIKRYLGASMNLTIRCVRGSYNARKLAKNFIARVLCLKFDQS